MFRALALDLTHASEAEAVECVRVGVVRLVDVCAMGRGRDNRAFGYERPVVECDIFHRFPRDSRLQVGTSAMYMQILNTSALSPVL